MKLLIAVLLLFVSAGYAQTNGTITAQDSGACTTAGACVSLPLPSNAGAVGLSISGTFSATVQFEVSADNGTTWVSAQGTSPSAATASSATAAGIWRFAVSGLTNFRVRGSAYSSGSVNVTIQYSPTAASTGSSSGGGAIQCSDGLGDGLNAIPAGTYVSVNCYNSFGVTYTITGIRCFSDNNGSSTLNAVNDAGTGLLTSAFTCNNAFAAGTQSATTTIASGHWVKFTFISDGATHNFTVALTATR